jgi:hypothetical protein
MHKSLSIVAIFISIYCHGQYFSDVAVSILSKEQLISRVVSNSQFKKNKVLTSLNNADTFDFDVVVYSDIFNNDGQTGRVLAAEPDYQIVAYTFHDSIFVKKIAQLKYIRDSGKLKMELTSVLSFIDTTRLLTFIEKHNYKYHSSWTLQDFCHQSPNYGSFGFLCGGINPRIQEEAYSLAKLVKTNDSVALKQLASSFSAQDRAFGSTGLFFLLQKGQNLSKELIDLVSINQESKIKIFYCRGCIAGEQTLAEALDISNLKSLYNFFVKSKLL